MVAKSRSRSHQCTGPHDTCSCSGGHCTRSLSSATTSASSDRSGPANATAESASKSLCLISSYISTFASASATAASQTTDFTHTRGEVDKEGIRYPSSDLSSCSCSHSNNGYLEANSDTEGDNDISASIYIVSDSEPGLALAPVSAEENISGFSANGTGCLPAHPRVPLALASTNTTSVAAMTLGTPSSAESSAPITTVAPDMSSASDTSLASFDAGASAVAEYGRNTYNYHMARTTVSVSTPSPTASAAPSTLPPTHSYHSMDAPSSSSRAQAKGDSDSCTESSSVHASSTSRLEAGGWNVSGAGTRGGAETPAVLDTPAFRTPLGVYNGFVQGSAFSFVYCTCDGLIELVVFLVY